MNRTEINRYLNDPELVANASSEELRRVIEAYPYCEVLYWIYLRTLYIHDDAIFEDELMRYGMHISNRRLFYNYLTTESAPAQNSPTDETSQLEILSPEDQRPSALNFQLATPDYFALEQNQEQKQSLQHLAAQLKAARLARQKQQNEELGVRNEEYKMQNVELKKEADTPQKTEEDAKKLIKEQKYLEAIEILRAISLNNPKKSANFALQIKFLETIINNHNKKE